jgi:hypothetical protein
MNATYQGFTFSDSDIANVDDWIPEGEYNPHNIRAFLLHDHGFVVAVVFAGNLQDALDEAVDNDKLDRFQIGESEMKDYPEDGEGISFLGNASEPFDIDTLGVVELPNPPRSFCSQFSAAFPERTVR